MQSNNTFVSCFTPLGSETVKQVFFHRNISQNKNETESLKALADKVLCRNKVGNKNETAALTPVSSNKKSETDNRDTALDDEDFIFQCEERAAIYEYEAGLSRGEAERLAYRDTALEHIQDHHPDLLLVINHTIEGNVI